MSELMHSPGPWVIDEVASFAKREVGHMVYAMGGDGYHGHLVCKLHHAHADNQTANARLIAAAPELLQSCRELLCNCEIYLGPMLCGGEMTKARAAIEKATNG